MWVDVVGRYCPCEGTGVVWLGSSVSAQGVGEDLCGDDEGGEECVESSV